MPYELRANAEDPQHPHLTSEEINAMAAEVAEPVQEAAVEPEATTAPVEPEAPLPTPKPQKGSKR